MAFATQAAPVAATAGDERPLQSGNIPSSSEAVLTAGMPPNANEQVVRDGGDWNPTNGNWSRSFLSHRPESTVDVPHAVCCEPIPNEVNTPECTAVRKQGETCNYFDICRGNQKQSTGGESSKDCSDSSTTSGSNSDSEWLPGSEECTHASEFYTDTDSSVSSKTLEELDQHAKHLKLLERTSKNVRISHTLFVMEPAVLVMPFL